ncbi:MAG: hypothetical protein KDA90_07780 [Planctomycetaceae bacterium]|nr:hypothetical protein [Planctomycetaceae bacterium]
MSGTTFRPAHAGPVLTCVLGLLTFLAPAASISAAPPATVAEAVKALDLTGLPLMKGAQAPTSQSVSLLSYRVVADCPTAYAFHKKSLTEQNWTEQPGAVTTEQYASGTFTHHGFVVSLSAVPLGDPQQPGVIFVSLTLHGNVDLKSLPRPAGMSEIYVGPQVAMYSTSAPVEETAVACRKLLVEDGWQPYGKAPGVEWFKQNAIRLTVSVSAAPAQAGKTAVSLSAEQLSADVPAPAETVQLQYADSTKQVLFDTKDREEDIVAFYHETLGKAGWKATTENPVSVDFKHILIFRNEPGDLFTLEMYPVKDEGVLRVTLRHQSAAEVAAQEKRLNEAMAAKKKLENTPTSKVSIALPAGATLAESSPTRIEFTVASGQGKAAADALRKSMQEAGWKEEVTIADGKVGDITFQKGNQEVSLSYVDPGFIPAEFTLRGRQVELEPARPGK